MSRPVPVRRPDGKWYLDLRWAGADPRGGSGQFRYGARDEAEAIHLAYEKLTALRVAQATGPQLPLAPRDITIGDAIKAFRPEKDRRREGGDGTKAYVKQYLLSVERELGKVSVSAFEGMHGKAMQETYRNDLADRGLSARTRSNRLSMLRQVLTFCHEDRGWLAKMPPKIDPTIGVETIGTKDDWRWYTEADFRALRAGLYRNEGPRARLKVEMPDPAKREAFIARRQLYMSVGFYTGMHTIDLDRLVGACFSVGTGHFLRTNTKSSASVPERMLKMPEPLWLDVKAEVRRIGRPWREDEPVAGGHWNQPTKEPNRAARRLDLPPWTYRIARRSTAHHLCLLGWAMRDVAEYLGHVDEKMIQTVYARVPIDLRSPVKLDWTAANMSRFLGGITQTGKVLRLGPHAAPAPWSKRKRKEGSTDGESEQ